MQVSILVVVDWLRRLRGDEPVFPAFAVSILVVVDWLRRHLVLEKQLPWNDRFNPCCGGLVAKTTEPSSRTLPENRFQSLLWWIGCEDVKIAGKTLEFRRVSILVVVDWLRRPIACSASGLWPICFNPCCGGLVAKTC